MTAPTRMELMAFADGEVDDERAREIERWLVAHDDERAFVEAICGLSEMVGEAAEDLSAPAPRPSALVRSTAPWDVAGCVMAAIDAESDEVEQAEAPLRSGPRLVPSPALHVGSPRPSPDSPPAAEAPALQRPVAPRVRYLREASLLVATLAAAAGIMVWASRGPSVVLAPSYPAPSVSEAVLTSASPSEDESEEDATAVDEVDFGDQQGAIFFVKGPKASRTAVVWIDEREPMP